MKDFLQGLFPNLFPVESEKHLQGKHNQKRHGWRFSGDKLTNARRAMRGQNAAERAEYRKRAGMQEPKKVERKPREAQKPTLHDKVKKYVGDSKTAEQLQSKFGGTGEKHGARAQYNTITAIEKLLIQNGKPYGGAPSLADQIMYDFKRKLERYGDKAYPLSDKQLGVVARDLAGYLDLIDNPL
jgi:hypothetical protein